MSLLFSGTSTGKLYESGERYKGSNGDTFVANRDGTFINERTGRASVGSSQSASSEWYSKGETVAPVPSVAFYTDAGKPILERPASAGGSGPAAAVVNPGGGGSGAASPQVTNGVSGVGGAGGRGAGSSLVVGTPQRGKDQGTSFADDPGPLLDVWETAPITPMMVGGKPAVHDRGWSDAGQAEERWGEGELLSPTWLYQWGVAIADVKAGLADWYLTSPLSGVSQQQRNANAQVFNDVAGALTFMGTDDLPDPMAYPPMSGW